MLKSWKEVKKRGGKKEEEEEEELNQIILDRRERESVELSKTFSKWYFLYYVLRFTMKVSSSPESQVSFKQNYKKHQ